MLDIIIPQYKNKENLIRTLNSITPNDEINVLVVDDFSQIQYDDIIERFPFVKIYYKNKNDGPGITRQKGIQLTNNPYIMFIDSGDYFIDKDNNIKEVLETIKNNPDVFVFSWQHLNNGIVEPESHVRLHARVYHRGFLEKYNISFSQEGSRMNEDVGFNRACRLILQHLEKTENNTHKKIIESPLIIWDRTDKNSITKKNNSSIAYEQQNLGLAINEFHVLEIARNNHLENEIILEEISEIMLALYYHFLCALQERPEFIQNAWDGAKLFYDKEFSKLSSKDPALLSSAKSHIMIKIRKKFKNWNFKIPININFFLENLQFNNIPKFYLERINI